ncbi:MAG: hypothetical protein DRJ10_07590 [Bacteroidetes bacterium]|nr:MAG: hypothetical protein DRJ07_13180 [Bacteroidota bacterium]RLD80315.1 MAG: hypothetical protein DRJ10_07590 [Bacteroidota bacterium]
MENILLILVLFFASIFVISSILIYSYIQKKGENPSFLLIRLFLFSYVAKYRGISKEETGQTGRLYYYWIISINLALLSFVVFVILKLI